MHDLLHAVMAIKNTVVPCCPYCGRTDGLRLLHDGGGYTDPEYTCEDCFTPRDDGPCFDDLPVFEALP